MNRPGFTMVEVLVALVAAGLLAATAHRGLAILADLETRAAASRERVLRAAAVRLQLTSWLRAAYVRTESDGGSDAPPFEGQDRFAQDGKPDDVVAFVTLAPGPFHGGVARVRLGIDHDPATSMTGLVARVSQERASAGPTAELALVPDATGLNARYRFDRGSGAEWFDGWLSTVQLPEAIELQVLGDSVPAMLRIPIVLPLGGGR